MTKRYKNVIRRISRRRTLQGLGATVGVGALGGCKDDPAEETSGDASTSGPGDTEGGTAGTAGTDGSTGGSTGGDETPVIEVCEQPTGAPLTDLMAEVDTVVVVMMENRSFDHYFGALSLEEGAPVDGLTGAEANLDRDGNSIGVFKSDYYTLEEDPPHGWSSSHSQWNSGANDGFVTQHQYRHGGSPGDAVMGYHVREQLPTLYSLADNYVLCDRWFASVMGPTWPNRYFLHLATSGGLQDNPDVGSGLTGFPSIFDRLTDAGLESRYYNSGLPVVLTYGRTEGIEPIENFFTAAAEGNLPSFCMVEPLLSFSGVIGNDDHPPADIRMGQAFLSTVYQALAQSPQWNRCLLIITYDEHGGFHDHVSPGTTVDEDPAFNQLGFRVPSLVIGPHVRQGCVTSAQLDHVSVASTLTRKWNLEPLNNRVMMTNDIGSAIDPNLIGAPRPPAELPPVEIAMPKTFLDPKFVGGQVELEALVARSGLATPIDRRREHEDVSRVLLEIGQRLGAVKLV